MSGQSRVTRGSLPQHGPHHPVTALKGTEKICKGTELSQRPGITAERGQAAKAAGPGTAPVQVAERLQAHSTCGHSTAASQAISVKNKSK